MIDEWAIPIPTRGCGIRAIADRFAIEINSWKDDCFVRKDSRQVKGGTTAAFRTSKYPSSITSRVCEFYAGHGSRIARRMFLMQSALKFQVEPDWLAWKQGVVAAIREFLQGTLSDVSEEDVDWEAWRVLYENGCTPAMAVSRAYLREV